MAWRNIYISKNARLSLHQESLVIKIEDEYRIPIEDIATVMIESNMVSLTSALLSKFAEYNVLVYFCDRYHLPNGILLPINQHSRSLKAIETQLNVSKPLKKRLWQSIIIRKILNQAIVLELAGKNSDKLVYYSNLVKSGDSDNVESVAANYYFKALFGPDFNRREDNTLNYALNYGYSIIRSAIARGISIYGFLPAFGIHHHSELNQFNLADDLFEPYRQIVDLWVYMNVKSEDTVNTEMKVKLFNLLNYQILIDNKVHSVLNAIEATAKSLSTAYRSNDYSQLLLPTLIPLQEHKYE